MKRKIKQSRLQNSYRIPVQITVFIGILFVLATAGRTLLQPSLPDEPIAGPARIVDGDSLDIAGIAIRLAGIDAPERDQMCERGNSNYRCGHAAQDALRQAISGRAVSCWPLQHDRYGRVIADCSVDAVDLSRAMVETGWAVTTGRHADAEIAARNAKRGLWAGKFEQPRDFRHRMGTGEGGLLDFLRTLWPW